MANMVILWGCPDCKASNSSSLMNFEMFIQCQVCHYMASVTFEKIDFSENYRAAIDKGF